MSFIGELKRRNVIRVAIAYLAGFWLILQVADLVTPLLDAPEWILLVLFYGALLGFPVAMILSWFYDLTPEGIKTADEVGPREAVHFTGRKIDFLIIGLLVIVVGFLLVDDTEAPALDHSIAILPFDNRSFDDEGAAFFAEGIHEDLIVLLSKLSDIRVISRKSVERFRDTDQSIKQIAKTLGVTTVLEGGVRVAGNRVRINVQLTEGNTETDLWAEVYDRELSTKNIFGIQNEVALNIVRELQATLSPDERQRLAVVPTQNLAAYEAYLLGKEQMKKRTIASLEAAIVKFRQATELDEGFALAYVGMADSYAVLQDWGHLPLEDVRPLIEAAATKALELDSRLGEAYVSLATLKELSGDYAAADAGFARAIELNPGYATAHSWYGLFLNWRVGRTEEALIYAEQALTLDPLSPLLRMAYGDALAFAGNFDNALSQYRRSIELDSEFGAAHKMIADHYLFGYGRTWDALESYRDAVEVEADPDWIGDIGGIYLVLGDIAAAEKWTEKARLTDPENIYVNRHLALLHYYRGENELAKGFAENYLDGPFDVFVPYMLFILRNEALRAGEYDEIQLRYGQLFPALAGEEPVVHRSNYRAAIDLSVVLQAVGEQERSERMLEAALVAVGNMPRLGLFGYGSADAEIYALQGKTEKAIAALQMAVDDGWWRHWYLWTELNPNLDSLREEPEYRAIIAELEGKMAAELADIRARESDGAVPGL